MNSLFYYDSVNRHIVSHIINGTETWNYSMLRRLYRLFGRSHEHQYFLECARAYFFERLFRCHKVKDINTLISRKIHKNVRSYAAIIDEFNRGFLRHERRISFEKPLDKPERCLIRYMALFYGYLYLCREKLQFDYPGDAYERIHESPIYKGQVITYEFLRRRHVNNLEYYDLIIDAPYQDKRAYRLKDTAYIKGVGFTIEFHQAECIKMIDLVGKEFI